MDRVVITGWGAKSSIGDNSMEMVNNIVSNCTGVVKSSKFKYLGLENYPIGRLDIEDDNFEIDPIEEKTHKLSKEVIDKALVNSNFSKELLVMEGERVGLSVGSSTLKTLKMQEFIKRRINHQSYIPLLLMGDSYLHNIASCYGIQGEVYNTSTACSSSTAAIGMAFDVISDGDMDIMIVVSADPLVEMTLAGFHSLQALSKEVCRPFDKNRNGISLGEGAVAIILENRDFAIKRGAPIIAEVLGYGIGNDAYSLTAPDPEGYGAEKVMLEAINQGKVPISEIGYINAHGTGTILNDFMELKAIDRLGFTGGVSSTKGYTGHCLATAGALELIISIEAHRMGVSIPNFNLVEPESSKLITESNNCSNSPYIISNSFAFGGNSASVLVKVAN